MIYCTKNPFVLCKERKQLQHSEERASSVSSLSVMDGFNVVQQVGRELKVPLGPRAGVFYRTAGVSKHLITTVRGCLLTSLHASMG